MPAGAKMPPRTMSLKALCRPARQLAQVRRHVEAEYVTTRALLIEPDLAQVELGGRGMLLWRLRKRDVDEHRRGRNSAPVKLEGDDAVHVLVLRCRAAGRDRVSRNVRAPVADLYGHVLHAVDRIGNRCRHDVATGLNRLQDLAGVGGVDPELTAAAALEHQVAGGAHDAAVIAADAR